MAYTLKAPVQKLAERVQERIDAEKIFEQEKTLAIEAQKVSSRSNLTPMLPGQDSKLTASVHLADFLFASSRKVS